MLFNKIDYARTWVYRWVSSWLKSKGSFEVSQNCKLINSSCLINEVSLMSMSLWQCIILHRVHLIENTSHLKKVEKIKLKTKMFLYSDYYSRKLNYFKLYSLNANRYLQDYKQYKLHSKKSAITFTLQFWLKSICVHNCGGCTVAHTNLTYGVW